jgi:hypothetical protein
MSKAFSVELVGYDKVKAMFKEMEIELSASQNRAIIAEAGKQIIDEAKMINPFDGDIGEDFSKDLAVTRDRRRAAKNAEYVMVGPKFKMYVIHGRDQKVATIAQHMTTGFRQTDRKTKQGEKRGRVREQQINPVLKAEEITKESRATGIQKGVDKLIKKLKRQNPTLLT